jgi:predicted Zn-dependent protease
MLLALALTWLSLGARDMPSTGFQYMAFARASLAHGDRGAAEHWCTRALARDPSRVDVAALLGRLQIEEGRYDAAEVVLEAAVLRDPSAARAWLELGAVRIATGRLDAGITDLMASVDADPRSAEAWTALAHALRSAGRNTEASAAERSLTRLEWSVEAP